MPPRSASVVVVGGGVMGASAAFHLAEAGVEDVVLLERAELASGSTSRAAGGVRAQFSDELNIRLGARSLEAFADFGRRPGAEIDLRRSGYLFVLTRPEDVEAFERGIALQNALGVPSRLVTPDEARELCPLLVVDDVLAAAFSPSDGHATPEAVVQGYAAGAREHGATILTRTEVTGIETEPVPGGGPGADAGAVATSAGRIETPAVICCAGAWSAAIGAMAGVPLPVEAVERRVRFTGGFDGLPDELPMTIDFSTGFYFHREGPGLLMGIASDDDDVETALAAAAERRAPAVAGAPLRGGWAGLYEMSPDHNALIGEAPHVSRLLYATGFSGHGFLQGPAVGEILRDLFLGREPFVDVTPLSVERFARDETRPESHVV
jgi:sarcosine oxidase, subunit beta